MGKKLKPIVVSILYGTVSISLVSSLMLLSNNIIKENEIGDSNNGSLNNVISEEVNLHYDESVPVVNNEEVVVSKYLRPYSDESVTIVRNYYDVNSDKETQENSLIYYENSYIKNTGVDYGSDDVFDVYSIGDGVVKKITEDSILGNVIVVEYDNLIVSYQSVENISHLVGEHVYKGEKIGTSGLSNIGSDLGNHLHLEVLENGININPECLFDMN